MDAMHRGSGSVGAGFSEGIRLLARLSRVAERAFLETGISLAQYRLLVSLSGRPQRASELAERLGVSRPTLTSLVDGLERSGLLRRGPVATDRRGVSVESTDAGLQAVARAESVLAGRLSRLVDRRSAAAASDLVSAVGAALDQ